MWSWRREALKSFYRQGDMDSMMGSLSAAVGGIAAVSLLAGGLYPTLKAAGAEPIETLRYE